jgi:hypothetical protein
VWEFGAKVDKTRKLSPEIFIFITKEIYLDRDETRVSL